MYIESIKVKNYRNFGNEPFEVELKPFTLIIGENNVGKTNLLNAIGLILSADISFYQKRVLEVDDINYKTVIEFKNQILTETDFENITFPEIRVELILTDFNKEQKSIVGDWHITDDSSTVIGKRAKISYVSAPNRLDEQKKWFEETKTNLTKIQADGKTPTIDNVDFPIHFYYYHIYGGENETKKIDFNWLGFFKMEFLDALRDAKNNLLAGGRNTLLYSILNSQTGNKISSVKSHLIELKEIISKEPAFKDIKSEIETYLKKISGEDENGLINFQFSGVDASEMLKRISLIYGSEPISIERNGLGRNNLLYISLLLSQLVKDADKKKTYFRLIGIEEPEAHLHPHIQIHLSKNIDTEKSKERQLLLTSHSTHITSQLPLENTVTLYRDDNKIKSYYLLNETIPLKSKNYLQKYLDATKSTMFFARRLILVEGISEQLVIPEYFKLFCNNYEDDLLGENLYKGYTLDKFGITVVNVQGISIRHFLEVIKAGYFIKCLVFTDSDDSDRADNLKEDFKDIDQIDIQKSELYTYEKDLINSNTEKGGKEILIEALIRTRKNNGNIYKTKIGSNPIIDIEEFFVNIYKETAKGKQNYKAEFAMNLVEVINDEKFKNKQKEFNIPEYIENGFNFLIS